MYRVPDLVRDSKLETRFRSGYTSHVYYESGHTARERAIPREERWKRVKHIGGGAYGKVYLEECVEGQRHVALRAVKQISKPWQPAKLMNYDRELEAIAKFSHQKYERCFVKSFGWYERADTLFIAMEYFLHGDLQHYLLPAPPLPESEVQQITFQILEGLSFMHDNGFAHRDLKPGNILIKSKPPEHWWVKIGDFGISKRAEDGAAISSTLKGTPAFMAPELHGFAEAGKERSSDNAQAADMWSLGELVFQMLTKEPTFKNMGLLFNYVQNPESFPSAILHAHNISLSGLDFIKSTMTPSPEKRPAADIALHHNWMEPHRPSSPRPSSITSIESLMLQEESSPLEPNLLDEPSGRWSTISIHDRQPLSYQPSSSTTISLASVEEQGPLEGIPPSSEPTTQPLTKETTSFIVSSGTHFRHPESEEPEKQRAQGFTGSATSGRSMVPDVLGQLKFGKCFARYINQDDLDRRDVKRPLRRSAIKIACPGRNCNQNATYDWICYKCEVPIEYGHPDQYIYCDCGRGPYGNYGFKCRELQHGTLFERYEKNTLLQLLSSLDSLDELNILIIGQTGVGKSTFINAFINYLTFDTLDESMKNRELNWVIPCSFNVQFMDRSNSSRRITQRKIKVGQDGDEADGATEVSTTQKTTAYPIILGNTVIRLIDTPGIYDTHDMGKNKENMVNILAMLRNFDKLHGILFLLNSRFNSTVRFVVDELLTHLHRDAARNLAFGFTNTRISHYMPGDTYTPLEESLAKYIDISLSSRTVYCFDSEGFRFLAAQKDGVIINNIQDFRSSWEQSKGEIKRLLEHFRSLVPHLVRNTLGLNRARELIIYLTKLRADIKRNIDSTIRLKMDNMRELTDTRLRGDKLRKRLFLEKVVLISHPLHKPRIVCSDIACTEYRDDGSGTLRTIYKSICQEEFYLTDVPLEIRGFVKLLECAAFDGKGNCQVCGHDWKNHLCVVTELKEKMVTVKDEVVEERLVKNAYDITLKEVAIENLKNMIAEADYEYQEIQHAMIRFGLFLKQNSIAPYNDGTLAYLDTLIKEELEKINTAGASRECLDSLLRQRLEHVQQVEVLRKNMKSGADEELLDEAGVENLFEHLYKLKHWGKNLRDIKNNTQATHLTAYRERPYRLRGRKSRSSWTTSSWKTSSPGHLSVDR